MHGTARTVTGLLVCAVSLALSGCFPQLPPESPFRMPEAPFRRQVGTVCQEELQVNPTPPDGAKNNVTQFETLLTEELQHASIKVIPAVKTMAIVKQVREAEGGYFDPYTGLRDETKYQLIRQRTFKALHDQLGCDARLIPAITIVTATWAAGRAQWDGSSEWLSGGGGSAGYLSALSLWISMRDDHDHEVYFGTGGIQVLSKIHEEFWDSRFEDVPVESLFTDRERNLRAIHNSLAPFIGAYAGSIDEPPPVKEYVTKKRRSAAGRSPAAEAERVEPAASGTGTPAEKTPNPPE